MYIEVQGIHTKKPFPSERGSDGWNSLWWLYPACNSFVWLLIPGQDLPWLDLDTLLTPQRRHIMSARKVGYDRRVGKPNAGQGAGSSKCCVEKAAHNSFEVVGSTIVDRSLIPSSIHLFIVDDITDVRKAGDSVRELLDFFRFRVSYVVVLLFA